MFLVGVLLIVVGISLAFFIPWKRLGQQQPQPLTGYIPVPGTDLQILDDHPRLWVTQETLSSIKCWAGITSGSGCGGNATLYQNFKTVTDQKLANGDREFYDIHQYALLYQLTGDASYCTVPIEVSHTEAESGALRREGKGPARSSTVAMTYDWCYDQLSESDKTLIGQYLVANAQATPFDNNHAFYPGESSGLVYAFSVFGDGVNDSAAGAMLKQHYEGIKNVNVPATNEVYANGGLDGYAGLRSDAILTFADLFKSGSTYTSMFEDSQFARNTALFFLHRTRGDLQLSKAPGKNNYSGIKLNSFLAHTAYRYNNQHAQWMANYLIEQNPGESFYELVMWRNPTVPSTPLDDPNNPLSLKLEGVGSGMYYGRSDWSFGPVSQAIHWGFFNGPDLVGHKTQNHFNLARGNDSLLIDSGVRTDDYDYTYNSYYRRSIAHNSIGITMPGEEFGDARGVPIPNDGGQWNSDKDEGCDRWPAACNGNSGYAPGWRGEVKRYEYVPGEYTYILGDATPAYNDDKTTQVERSFIELEPNLFIVFDAVNATQASFEKAFYLHMIEKPAVNGTLQTQEGNYDTGGIFDSTNSNVVTVRYGDSAVLSKTLLPENPRIRIVGGQNPNGDPVRHNNSQINYPPTYDPQQSYEYFNEWNWPPASLENVGEYDDDQRYGRNGASSNTPAGGEGGDWRIEVRPNTVSAIDNFFHVYQVRDGDLFVDNTDPGFSTSDGGWTESNYNAYGYGMYGNTLVKARPSTSRTATWNFTVTQTGAYDVNVWLPKKNNRDLINEAKYTIRHAGGETVITLDQNDGQALWVNLGSYQFDPGTATVELSTDSSDGSLYMTADAMKLSYQNSDLPMVDTQLLRSENQNMVGSFIDGRLVALLSKDGSEVASTDVEIPAEGVVQFRIFGMRPDTNFSVSRNEQRVSIRTGSGERSTDQGVLSFTIDFSGEGGEEDPVPTCTLIAHPQTGVGPFTSYLEARFSNLPEDEERALLSCSADDPGHNSNIYNGDWAYRPCLYSTVTETTEFVASAVAGGAECSTVVTVLPRTEYLTEFSDDYTANITENPTINQGTIQNVEWDGVSSYQLNSESGGPISASSPGLVALWRMNDPIGDGITDDATTNGNRGTCDGINCPTEIAGKFNNAYLYDGLQDEIDVASSTSLDTLDTMTASMWVKMAVDQDNQTLISFYKSSTDRVYLWYTSEEGIRIYNDIDNQGSSEIVTGYKPTLDQWVHVAWVIDGIKWHIYINGQPYSSNETQTMSDLDDGFTVSIGRRSENDRPWNGAIDETAIWSRALSQTEILNLIGGSGTGSFESNNLAVPEYDNLRAQWLASGTQLQVEINTGGENWCEITNGGLFNNPACPQPATALKYRVNFTGPVSLDRVHFEWDVLGESEEDPPSDDGPGGGGKLPLQNYE
ncbi:MAG: LamG-like jellyroll fold domain-containing protein [bacterium]|nr:LamG-like jellyroll fold domain-containing protein [bacterium]